MLSACLSPQLQMRANQRCPWSRPRCLSTLFALLLAHIVAQTGVRLTATRASVFHNTDWPWSPAASHASSAVFSLHQLEPRLVTGSISSASSAAAIAGVKFVLLNYVVISQMAMVVAGLASARENSAASVESPSVVVGSIALITSGALLLHNAAKLAKLVWRKSCRRQEQADRRRRSRGSFY